MHASMVVSSPELTEKIMMRYFRKMGDNAIDAIIIAKADRLSAQGPEITQKIINENINRLDKLLKFCIQAQETLKPLPKLLDGNEIMQIFDLKPSREVGVLKQYLKDAVLDNQVPNEREPLMQLLLQKAEELGINNVK